MEWAAFVVTSGQAQGSWLAWADALEQGCSLRWMLPSSWGCACQGSSLVAGPSCLRLLANAMQLPPRVSLLGHCPPTPCPCPVHLPNSG